MMKFFKTLLPIFLMVCLILPFAQAEEEVSLSETTFSVIPILPDNQISGVSSFNLQVTPGQEQVLRVQVYNYDDEEISVILHAYPAFTNAYGVAQYAPSEGLSNNAPISFEDLITIEEDTLDIPASSSAIAEFSMQVPEEPFEGIIMGGFVIEKSQKTDALSSATPGMSIQHKYAYAIAVRLREHEETVNPSFTLEGVTLTEWMGMPLVESIIGNPSPSAVKPVFIESKIVDADTQEVMIEDAMETVTMVPYALMPYRIFLEGENALRPGAYDMLITVKYGKDTWDFQSQFTVDEATAE